MIPRQLHKLLKPPSPALGRGASSATTLQSGETVMSSCGSVQAEIGGHIINAEEEMSLPARNISVETSLDVQQNTFPAESALTFDQSEPQSTETKNQDSCSDFSKDTINSSSVILDPNTPLQQQTINLHNFSNNNAGIETPYEPQIENKSNIDCRSVIISDSLNTDKEEAMITDSSDLKLSPVSVSIQPVGDRIPEEGSLQVATEPKVMLEESCSYEAENVCPEKDFFGNNELVTVNEPAVYSGIPQIQTQDPSESLHSSSEYIKCAPQYITSDMHLDSSEIYTSTNDFRYNLSVDSVPMFVAGAFSEFTDSCDENFLRGCKWSPDGNLLVTNSNDNCLRIFQPLPVQYLDNGSSAELKRQVLIRESGQIYDFAWHPQMSLGNQDFCKIACTCNGIPIQMWDSTTGKIVANYRAYDQFDEVTAAYSLSFSLDGSKIYAGYNRAIRIFDTEYPVRSCKLVKTFNTQRKDGQTGIISCFAHSPDNNGLYVAGSYSRHIGMYDSTCDKLVCLMQGQQGGVTHIMFSPDGTKLYSGGRKDAEILCWDTRNMGKILFSALRDVKTNQRIYFDVSQSGRYLMSGNHDGTVAFWDTLSSFEEINGDVFLKPCSQFLAHGDCVNGVSFNQHQDLIATASGQRHFQVFDVSDSDDSDQEMAEPWDFSLKIWRIPVLPGDVNGDTSHRYCFVSLFRIDMSEARGEKKDL
ncbi:telomerase Cajal body protein 1-like [Physella acuta]|uniref:telomerase Cajal body protein 1-like n=1 Tax=Physella acuta TaxID=109671 RepID=UPI0027DB5838|nr:telomerase Cajal body protein 1-like [Physella acuta]